MTELNLFFKALADNTRLRIVNILNSYEMNVNELTFILDMGQSRISRHLKILLESNIIVLRKEGLSNFYKVVSSDTKITNLLESVLPLLNDTVFKYDLKKSESKIRERNKLTECYFESIASKWEGMKKELMGNFDLTSIIAESVGKDKKVVDLGCGTGDLIAKIAADQKYIIGVDKSPAMLKKSEAKLKDINNCNLRIGELEHLPLKENEVDTVIINMVLHHIADPAAIFREAGRVLESRGTILITDFLSHNNEVLRDKYKNLWLGFSGEIIREWLEASGFSNFRQLNYNIEKDLKGFLIKATKI